MCIHYFGPLCIPSATPVSACAVHVSVAACNIALGVVWSCRSCGSGYTTIGLPHRGDNDLKILDCNCEQDRQPLDTSNGAAERSATDRCLMSAKTHTCHRSFFVCFIPYFILSPSTSSLLSQCPFLPSLFISSFFS